MTVSRGEQTLHYLAWWLAILIPLSVLLNIYVIAMWRVPLPSYDVVDHHVFLSSAALGQMDWEGLWERHNGVHLIVLPKLIMWLDMYFVSGQGWLVTFVSATAILATLLIVFLQLFRLHAFTLAEQRVFCLLAALMLSSVMLAESLLNPIDIQWSLLALGSCVSAYSLHGVLRGEARAFIWLAVGSLGSWLSSGPVSLLLLSILLSAFMTQEDDRRINAFLLSRQFIGSVVFLLSCICLWEWLALQYDWPLLLAALYKPFFLADDWVNGVDFLRMNQDFYTMYFGDALVFIARFVLVPVGHQWSFPLLICLPFIVWFLLLWRSVLFWRRDQVFFIFLTIFSLLLCIAAGFMRFFTLYNFRHANMGLLLLLSSAILIYISLQMERKQQILSVLLICYSTLFMFVAVKEAGAWSYEGQNTTRYWQLGDALGVQDPIKFAPVWKYDPKHQQAVDHSRAIFRQQGVGVYGSSLYRYFSGSTALPEREVECEHELLLLEHNDHDLSAFSIKAISRAGNRAVARALVLHEGRPVGLAAGQMETDIMWEQWRQPGLWGGFIRVAGSLPTKVEVVAFDNELRCKPWQLNLTPSVP